MTDRDALLERLEGVNPVPDPNRLYEDLRLQDPRVAGRPPRLFAAETQGFIRDRASTRRGWRIAAATASLVVLVGASIALFANNPSQPVAGGRELHLTIDGDNCLYEGPRELAAGEVAITYRNASPEGRWANTLRLDDDRTVADAVSYIATDPLSGAPPWSSPVWLFLLVLPDSDPVSRLVSLEPGTHLLLCGDEDRGAILGADIEVTP